jgi:hypothetical protein
MPSVDVAVLVLSGSMGAGKTTVLGEASDLLLAAGVPHAAIDLDALSIGHFPGDLSMRNLAAVWSNYAAVGMTRLLLADADPDRARIAQAVPGARIVVCRLRASIETMQQRVRAREPGMRQQEFVERVAELERAIDGEDFSAGNDGRDITAVAREVLTRAGWL